MKNSADTQITNCETTSEINVWNFVEENYPNYYKCGEIAENDDLQKIVDGEINGDAEDLYNNFLTELGDEEQVIVMAQNRLHESNAYIFQRAIEGFLAKQATTKI